jgi:mannitol/fructose-specific phosphotransferase system IIA component
MANPAPAALLDPGAVRLGLSATGAADAVRQCGEVLIEIGAVDAAYAAAMQEREADISTYIGEGVAIPHGTDESRQHIRRSALAVLQFPDGVDWHGEDVRVCIAIAVRGSEHVGLLASLANILLEPDQAAQLRAAADPDTVIRMLESATAEQQP